MPERVEALGILGLGRMGRPIAEALARSGFDVSAYDSDPGRLSGLTDSGIRPAESAAALYRAADVLITVLPGPSEVQDAMTGAGGALANLPPGAVWLDLTSNDPRVIVELAREAGHQGLLSVEAPMGGGVEAAASGSLSFFVSGAPAAVGRVRPILAAVAQRDGIRVVGDGAGLGTTVKLLANLLWFGQSVAVTEAMLVGSASGVDVDVLRDALAASAGGSRFIDDYLDSLLRGDYLESFGIDRVVEELDTVAAIAAETGMPFALSEVVARVHRDALEAFGPVDGELLGARVIEQRAGVTLSSLRKDAQDRASS
jgi:3-hydroxyisobutyrate dehydrogenase-like beta-hydroxyacid dehydrogenase